MECFLQHCDIFLFSYCLLCSVDPLLFKLNLFAYFAVSPLAALVVNYRLIELFFTKIGPKGIRKIKFRISTLPQKEITDPLFSSCPYKQIGIGETVGGKLPANGFFIYIFFL